MRDEAAKKSVQEAIDDAFSWKPGTKPIPAAQGAGPTWWYKLAQHMGGTPPVQPGTPQKNQEEEADQNIQKEIDSRSSTKSTTPPAGFDSKVKGKDGKWYWANSKTRKVGPLVP